MFYGFLPPEKEAVLIKIMTSSEKMEIIDGNLIFTMPDGGRPVVKITSLAKPMKLGNFEDRNESTIMKKCVVVEFDHDVLPIFKGGDIFVNALRDGMDVPQRTHIKSQVAATFFNYALTVYGRLGGDL